MCVKRYCITLILLLFGTVVAYSQEDCTEKESSFRTDEDFVDTDTLKNSVCINKRCQNIEVHFKFDKYNLELNYMDNKVSLQKLAHQIDSIGVSKIDSIVIVSQSSPEGVYEHNLMLSKNRATTMHKYILNNHPELSECLFVYPEGESWIQLREYVKKDTLMKNSSIEKVISIIDADINVGTKKWRMKQLPVYRYLLRTYYPRIRNSIFCIVYYSEIIPKKIDPVCKMKLKVENIVPDSIVNVAAEIDLAKLTSPSKYTVFAFRSNLLAPLMNVGVQVPIGNKWSVGADYYYPWAFRKDDHKNCFQLLGLNMEGRYWFGANRGLHNRLKGHSVGVTIGGGYFDFEKNFKGDQGEYLLIGADYLYAMPVFKGKLHLEFSLGLGYIYSSMRPYEVFEPGGKAFKKGYSKKNHWVGPVKAAISLVIPIKKKRSHE